MNSGGIAELGYRRADARPVCQPKTAPVAGLMDGMSRMSESKSGTTAIN